MCALDSALLNLVVFSNGPFLGLQLCLAKSAHFINLIRGNYLQVTQDIELLLPIQVLLRSTKRPRSVSSLLPLNSPWPGQGLWPSHRRAEPAVSFRRHIGSHSVGLDIPAILGVVELRSCRLKSHAQPSR